jgi:hypothetical protein
MGLVPHIEVHPVDPSIFVDKQQQLRAVGLPSPYTVRHHGFRYWGHTNKTQGELPLQQ